MYIGFLLVYLPDNKRGVGVGKEWFNKHLAYIYLFGHFGRPVR